MTIISTERLEEMRLLPCPFCGVSLVLTEQEQWVHPWDDVCPADDIHIHYRDEPRINAWNRRSLDKGEVVKPLEWREAKPNGWVAVPHVGDTYAIKARDNGRCIMFADQSFIDGSEHTTEQEAKAAAEADYRSRILSALLPKATAPVVSEPVAWRCFYCDEVFHSTKEAERHFGPRRSLTERKPACQIDSDHVRKVEQAHEDAMKRVSASAWVNGTDEDREKLEIAATRLFWGQKIEGKPCSQEEWRHIIDRFEFWVDVGADGYNVAADRLASLIAFHMATTQTQSLEVTEEMVERAYEAFVAACEWSDWDEPEIRGYVRAALEAAMKED